MKKLLKIVGIALAALILLIVIGIFVLTTFVNPNAFKGQISQTVKQKTGCELNINGDISWSFFPGLGFKVKDITLKNIPKFTEQDFVKAGEVDVRVQLIPLIHKQIHIDKINIKQAHVLWTNPKTKQTIKINNLHLQSSNITFKHPFNIKSDFDFQKTNPNYAGHLNITSKININLDNKHYNMENLQIKGYIKPAKLKAIDIELNTDIFADLQQQTFKAQDINLEIANLEATGEINGTKILNAPDFKCNLSIPIFNPKQFFRAFGINIKTQDEKALTAAAITAVFSSSPQLIQIPALQITLDKSRLQGNIKTINLKNKSIDFNLAMNSINLNRYTLKITSIKTNSKPKTQTQSTKVTPQSSVAAGGLSQWSTRGNLNINKLTAGPVYANNLKMGINTNKGLITFSPIRANLYQGTMIGQVRINTRSSAPRLSVITSLSKIQVAAILSDFANTSNLTGTAYCNLNLTTQGNKTKTMLQNLNGKGKIDIRNGSIKGVDINYLFRMLDAMIKKVSAPAKPKQLVTNFSSLSGTFIIRNGTLRNNDMLLTAPTFKVAGNGTVNLVSQSVNYKVRASRIRTVTIADKKAAQVSPLFIPIIITGTFGNLRYIPDFTYVLQTLVKQLGQTVVQSIVTGKDITGTVTKGIGKRITETLGIDKLFK